VTGAARGGVQLVRGLCRCELQVLCASSVVWRKTKEEVCADLVLVLLLLVEIKCLKQRNCSCS
jgi:hypothetical protein